jgi:hypothetical protein
MEAMADQLWRSGPKALKDFIDEDSFDPLRNYARWGVPRALAWPYSERRIYPAGCLFAGRTGRHEVLNEWTFLHTEEGEMYFVLAILGVEYAINVVGPGIESYELWQRRNEGRSPLHPGSRLDALMSDGTEVLGGK